MGILDAILGKIILAILSKHTIITSLLWKFFERAGTQLVQLIVSIVLARLLTPADFGVIALVLVFISISNVFVQSGFSTALIQKKDADDLDFSSVFYLSLGLAALVYGILVVTAPCIANFYNRLDVIPVIRVLGLTLFLGVFNSIQMAYIARHMMFKKLFYRSIGAIIPAGFIGILLAYLNFGVWALVYQQLANVFFACVIMWFTVRWRPQLKFSLQRVKGLFSFGWKLLISALLDTGYNNLQSLVIGKMFLPAMLGFYNRGNQFPSLIVSNINASIESVMFPSLSAIQNDILQVKKIVRRAIVTSSFLILPIMAGLAASAEPLVLLVLGSKWLPCVPFLRICCLIYAFWPIHTMNLSAINALGHSGIFLKLEILKKIFGVGILILAVFVFNTVIAIAVSAALASAIAAMINAFPNKRLLHYGYLEQMRDILPSLVLSFMLGVGVYLLSYLNLNPLVLMALQCFLGGSIYIGVAKLLHFECLIYLINTLKEFKHGQ